MLKSPIVSCSHRWQGSAIGSSASRPSATEPASRSARWSAPSVSTTARLAPSTSCSVIHPDEHPVAIQLFGHGPEAMHSAAGIVAKAGAEIIDINMGCPVKKVRKTGAGAELIENQDLAVELAQAAIEGSGGLPVTVKLRSGIKVGDTRGLDLAVRLATEAGVSGIAFHPRSAQVHHKGTPDYGLVRQLTELIDVPVIVSGGLDDADSARRAYEESNADAVMIARGSFGNPWIFEQLTGQREELPPPHEIATELLWIIDRCEEHLGAERSNGYLRKFYPWYLNRMGLTKRQITAFQTEEELENVRSMVIALQVAEPVAASL